MFMSSITHFQFYKEKCYITISTPSKARSDNLHSAGLNSKIHRGFMVLTEALTKSTKPPGRRISAELSIFIFVHSRCSAKQHENTTHEN